MVSFACFVIAIVALVRVARLERELQALRRRMDASDSRLWRPVDRAGASTAPAVGPEPAASEPVAQPTTPAVTRPVEGWLPTDVGTPAPTPPAASIPTPAQDWLAPPAASAGSPPPHVSATEALERRIGERLLLYAGMVLVVFAVGFFLRYAFEHDWLSPAVRVALGTSAGIAFAAGGHWLARRGYEQYGLFLCGGGFALLFLSVYAAFAIYALIGQGVAFGALVAVAGAAAVIADRHVSLPMALMAVCGGFAAPFLVSTGADAQIALFTYDGILIAATMYLARRRAWPSLNLASFVFTLLTVTAWMLDRYTPSRYLVTEGFLTAYCAMFVAILRDTHRSGRPDARVVTVILGLAPVLYHLASVAILFDHGVAFLIYISLASAAVVVASLEANIAALRFVGWLAIIAPLAIWVSAHQRRGWVVASVVVAVGTWLLSLAPAVRSASREEPLDPWDMRLIHSTGLGAFGVVYVAMADLVSIRTLALGAWLFAAANAAGWAMLRKRSADAVHWLGVACALAAVAVAIGFSGYWTVVMWSAEAAALMWIGRQAGRVWFRIGGLILFAIAIGVWLQIEPPDGNGSFTVVLNARALSGAFVIAMLYLVAAVERAAIRTSDGWSGERGVLLVTAHALTVVLISLEIVSFWETRTLEAVDANLARQLMLSSAWAIYAGAIIAIGMHRHSPPIRYFAIALFALTALKVVVVDTQALEGIYRVIAFLVVGAIMLAASFLYQRVRGTETRSRTADPTSAP